MSSHMHCRCVICILDPHHPRVEPITSKKPEPLRASPNTTSSHTPDSNSSLTPVL